MDSVEPFAAAVKARMDAEPALAGIVTEQSMDPARPTMEPPYVILYVAMPQNEDPRLAGGVGNRIRGKINVVPVGIDATQARFFAARTTSVLEGWAPDVPGWEFEKFEIGDDERYADTDYSFSPPVTFYSLEFTTTAKRKAP
jgi:hypothetical protein